MLSVFVVINAFFFALFFEFLDFGLELQGPHTTAVALVIRASVVAMLLVLVVITAVFFALVF